MVKKIATFSLFIGVLMGASLDTIKIKNIEVPFIYEENKFLPTINLQIIFKQSGSMKDGELSGLASMSAKILNEGTKKDGATNFAKKLEARAIHLGVSSGLETAVINVSCMKTEFNEAISLLKKLLENPNLTEDSLKKVKIETEGVLLSKQQDFDFLASLNLNKILFKGTPIESSILGTRESIKSIGLKDIKSFIKEHFVLNRAIVLIGGDIKKDESRDLVSSILEILDAGKVSEELYFEAHNKEYFISDIKETKQAYIYFGSPFFMKADDKMQYKAKVMAFILGSGGFGSRMMEEIRVKKGLAYSAYSRIHLNKTHSHMKGFLQTKLENEVEAIEIVKRVIKDFLESGATEKELDGAKKFILGSEPLRNELLNQRLSSVFMDFYKGLPLDFKDEELKNIENLTLEELNNFIREHQEILKLSFSVIKADKE